MGKSDCTLPYLRTDLHIFIKFMKKNFEKKNSQIADEKKSVKQ